MGLIFKIRLGNNGNRSPNRGQRPASWLAERSTHRLHRVLSPVPAGVSCRRPQSLHPQQVVSARHEVAPGLRSFQSPISAPSEAAHGLDPANNLFHSFSNPLARRRDSTPNDEGYSHHYQLAVPAKTIENIGFCAEIERIRQSSFSLLFSLLF